MQIGLFAKEVEDLSDGKRYLLEDVDVRNKDVITSTGIYSVLGFDLILSKLPARF